MDQKTRRPGFGREQGSDPAEDLSARILAVPRAEIAAVRPENHKQENPKAAA